MTYNVLMGTLNPIHSLIYSQLIHYVLFRIEPKAIRRGFNVRVLTTKPPPPKTERDGLPVSDP